MDFVKPTVAHTHTMQLGSSTVLASCKFSLLTHAGFVNPPILPTIAHVATTQQIKSIDPVCVSIIASMHPLLPQSVMVVQKFIVQ